MREFVLQKPHEVIFGSALQVKKICSDERGTVIGDGLDRRFEPRRLRGKAGDHWSHEAPGIHAGLSQLTHRPESLQRRGSAWFERSPRRFVYRWNAHIYGATSASP